MYNKPEWFYKVERKVSYNTDPAFAKALIDYSFAAACLTEEAVLNHFSKLDDREEIEATLKGLDWNEYYYHTETLKTEDGIERRYDYRVSLEELEW